MLKTFNIKFPIAGVLYFDNVTAENKAAAISKCYGLVTEATNQDLDPIQEFNGEWDMYEHIAQGSIVYAPLSHVSVEEC